MIKIDRKAKGVTLTFEEYEDIAENIENWTEIESEYADQGRWTTTAYTVFKCNHTGKYIIVVTTRGSTEQQDLRYQDYPATKYEAKLQKVLVDQYTTLE